MLILLWFLFSVSAPAETKADATFDEYVKLYGLDRGNDVEPEAAYAELKKENPVLYGSLREHLAAYASSADPLKRQHAFGWAVAAQGDAPLPAATVAAVLASARKATADAERDAREQTLAWNLRSSATDKPTRKEME